MEVKKEWREVYKHGRQERKRNKGKKRKNTRSNDRIKHLQEEHRKKRMMIEKHIKKGGKRQNEKKIRD